MKSPAIRVAIVDEGFDWNHPALLDAPGAAMRLSEYWNCVTAHAITEPERARRKCATLGSALATSRQTKKPETQDEPCATGTPRGTPASATTVVVGALLRACGCTPGARTPGHAG